jgi:hypothetical protein
MCAALIIVAMEEASENSKKSSHSAHGSGIR